MLEIKNLCVSMNKKPLLQNINMVVKDGARHRLIGHNGSGKSTLVNTIAGDTDYKIDSGKIIFNDIDITHENATTRSLMGIFLGAQNVPEIPGLTVLSFLNIQWLPINILKVAKNYLWVNFWKNWNPYAIN